MTTWTTLREEDKGEAFDVGTVKGKNGTYPTWWPPPFKGRDGTLLETLHGFPYLTWWGVEKEKLFPQFPKITISTFDPPSDTLLATMPRIEKLEKIWAEEASKLIGQAAKWVDVIGRPMADFWDSDSDAKGKKLWEPYLVRNCKQQLQFFGVPVGVENGNDQIYNSDSNYFKKSLVYYPGRWTLMVNFTLMILITRQIRLYPPGPFIPWNTSVLAINPQKGTLPFPIMDWIKSKNLPQIKLYADSLRGRGNNLWRNTNPRGVGFGFGFNTLKSLAFFQRFYESDGFSNLKHNEIYYILKGSEFITSYGNIITLYRATGPASLSITLNEIDKPTAVLGNPYASLTSFCEWMLWSLAVMYIDLKENQTLWNIFSTIDIDGREYEAIYGERLKDEKKNQAPAQKVIAAITDTVIPALTPGGVLTTDLYGPPVDTSIITGSGSIDLNTYLNRFRSVWRKTALFHVFGIGSQEWPVEINAAQFEKDSYESDIYNFIQDNPPRRLRIPPLDSSSWITFSRLNPKWEDGFILQFTQYIDWITKNVQAQKKEFYSPPGTQLKSPKGELLTMIDQDGNIKPLINSFPDVMMVAPPGGLKLSTLFSFAFVFIDQIGKAGWGTDWEDAINNFGKKVWVKIKEALVALVDFVVEVIKLLPDIWPWVLALGAGVGIFFVGETFLSEKIKRLAD